MPEIIRKPVQKRSIETKKSSTPPTHFLARSVTSIPIPPKSQSVRECRRVSFTVILRINEI